MKKLLLWLCFMLPILGTAQSSWVHIQLLTDNFPSETSFPFLSNKKVRTFSEGYFFSSDGKFPTKAIVP